MPSKSARAATKATSDTDTAWLTVVGARQNNLRGIDVDIPLGRFVCVTGVSGSGKSSLVNDILRETLAKQLNGATKVSPGKHDRIDGLEHLDKVIDIDQSPIGRTPRSNPATYIKVFDRIRDLYAKLPDAKVRGYKPGRFSFNVPTGSAGGGRCEACEGNGSNRMEMDFLADVWVTCPVCQGKRFMRETLQILYKGKSIADVLEMDVEQALAHFENVPKVAAMLSTLHDVGLDYLHLGQSSTTLSGGEAQRIKLARELVKVATGRTLYILDEPTTGLHFADIKRLLAVLHGFVDAGNSVVVIEHNLDVVKTADWVIDLGPEGGAAGGRIVAQGTPEKVARAKRSHTGQALRPVLSGIVPELPQPARRDAHDAAGRSARGTKDAIAVTGARQHNLKGIDVSVPRGKMTVCCGPSGSGKSSLAIDTIYTEGQRRYVESLSAYARQFLSQMQPPRVEHISGLSPSVCIEQKTTSKSPRSTVGTVTEIYDYMRILWARIGQPYCPTCKIPIGTQSSEEIVEKVLALGEDRRILLLAPVEPTGQETYNHLLKRERANGYARARIDGIVHELDDDVEIDGRRRHTVELVVDRLVLRNKQVSRISDSIEQALAIGQGVVLVAFADEDDPTAAGKKKPRKSRDLRFSQHHACDQCGRSYDEITPHHFSFNARMGWCEACEGLGVQQGASPAAIVVHPTRSIADGAIAGFGELTPGTKLYAMVLALASHVGFDLHEPWSSLSEPQRLAVLQGCGEAWITATLDDAPRASKGKKTKRSIRFRWRGFFPAIDRATRTSWSYRKQLEALVTEVACTACAGSRLRRESAAVRLNGTTIFEACAQPMGQTLAWFKTLDLDVRQRKIAEALLHEITSRLKFLVDVGLDYITLHRTASTLSGGEAQRIQLAAQIGTGLTGVLYVLDEPTIGLHPRDNDRLIQALMRLRDLGNTLMVVEHDREVIDSADHVLDFGPGAGHAGGEITAAASPANLRKKRKSLTGRYLSLKEAIPVPANRRPVPAMPPVVQAGRTNDATDSQVDPNDEPTREDAVRWLTVVGARENNLKEINVSFPLGRFTCVTGASGSGKSTLVSDILHKALAVRLHRARLVPGGHERIDGMAHVDKIINVDQSPIGNSPTSNPATYTGVFDAIRELYAKLPVSKVRGYGPNRFSFNRPGGRCEACQGMGQRCIEMHFLPDVWIECEHCKGTRYVAETLEATYHGQSIADVLSMRVSEALALFQRVPKVCRMLQTLDDVGLGYVQLGQSAPTLSGGEAQRVKLATELGRPSTGKTLYVLDEPTTGLHFDDLKKLLGVLHRLVDLGNTCICIEHNLDVIKTADWVIDLGPEAAAGGGTVVVEGTPEVVAHTPDSHTGKALKPALAAGPIQTREVHHAWVEADRQAQLGASIDLGDEVQMPWERDGRTWHTVDHVDREGRPTLWSSDLLIWLIETMEALGPFDTTDWNNRARVEVRAKGKGQWFAHVLTGGRQLLDVILRVAKGTFHVNRLRRDLGIKTLDERTDLPIYGQSARVIVRKRSEDWQEIRLVLRDFSDIDKPAFTRFLATAATTYFRQFEAEVEDPQRRTPWKADGQGWHLSQRGINHRHKIRWKPTLLMTLIGKLKKLQPDLTLDWAARTSVSLIVPAKSKPVGKIVTNIGDGLRVELRMPPSAVTPTQIDRLGIEPEVKSGAPYDRLVFWLRSLDRLDSGQLRGAWRACVDDAAPAGGEAS